MMVCSVSYISKCDKPALTHLEALWLTLLDEVLNICPKVLPWQPCCLHVCNSHKSQGCNKLLTVATGQNGFKERVCDLKYLYLDVQLVPMAVLWLQHYLKASSLVVVQIIEGQLLIPALLTCSISFCLLLPTFFIHCYTTITSHIDASSILNRLLAYCG